MYHSFYYQWSMQPFTIHVGRTSNPGYPDHFHENVEFLYLNSGHYKAIVNDIDYDIKEGDLVVVFPYQRHEYVQTVKDNKEFVFSITPSLLPGGINALTSRIPKSSVLRAEDISDDCRNAIFWLYRTRSTDEDAYDLRKALVNAVFWYVCHHMEMIDCANSPGQKLQKILRYCSEHFTDEDLSLDNISAALGINKFQISRIISDNLKINYSTYINLLRTNLAREQLRTTDESITNIALDCGYGTIRNFNRVFYQYNQMSPREFRERARPASPNKND